MGFEIQNHVLIKYTEEPGVTEVIIPDGVTEIERSAFSKCQHLERVHIPETVVIIGESAFYGCTRLKEINLPEKLTWIQTSTFEKCKSLKHITLPENTEIIFHSAFWNTNLKEIVIPEHVRGMEDFAFEQVRLIFHKNQKNTRIILHSVWLEAWGTHIMFFLNHPSYENFSVLEAYYKFQIAVSYYDADEKIRAYLKRMIKKAVSTAIEHDDTELLKDLLHTGFVTKKNIDFMIDDAIQHTQKTGNPECQVILMHEKQQKFPPDEKEIARKFRL